MGSLGQPAKNSIAAIATAVDCNSLRIGDTPINQPFNAVGNIVLHALAPLHETGLPEASTVTGRTAEIHLQHSESAVGQKLHLGIESPFIPSPWTPVWIDDNRQILRRLALWHSEITVNGHAVARFLFYGLHLGQLLLFHPC